MGEKKPNAANITHGLAQLGGGSKKDGGGGMMQELKRFLIQELKWERKLYYQPLRTRMLLMNQ